MKKCYFIALLAILAGWLGVSAQVTTEPSPLQEDATDVVIYFHADQGNKGLMGVSSSTGVYAHTGVCVKTADGKTKDWQYAPTWGDNSAKYRLEYVSPNLWKLTIGNLRSYYGVPANETITKLAFVFRTADKSKEGKAEGGKDIFVDVYQNGLQIALTSSQNSQVVDASTGAVTFTVGTTVAANINLSVNGTTIGEAGSAKSLTAEYTFPSTGDYTVTATATAGGETVSTSLEYCYVSESKPSTLTVAPPMGATRNADGSVTFCLAAPQKKGAIVVGSWNSFRVSDKYVMDYIDVPAEGARYFTTTVAGLEKGTPFTYYYLVDGEKKVGDPYARLVLVPEEDKWIGPDVYPGLPEYPEELNGQNIALAYFDDNINAYDWKVKSFKGVDPSQLVIYELLFRDFTGTEGKADGNGTVRKAIEKIPYLKSLGVNAVELLPINEFNGNISWGYNPNFYFAPDKAYGTPDDYKEFIDLCHQNGMAVILDVVFNQSDWMHPWYQLYSAGANPFYNATAPHAYSVLNDWNQGFPLVQRQWKDVLKYWIEEYNVDGYRFDLVKGLGDNDSYANSSGSATDAYNASRVARMKELHDAIREVKADAYFINENLAGAKEENEMAADGELNWANINEGGCQFAMGYSSGSSLARMYAPLDSRDWGSTVSYLESHDEERLAYKQDQWGASGVKGNAEVSMNRIGCAAAQMFMTPGAHMIWQFSEMGNAQTTKNSSGNETGPKVVNWNLMDKPANKSLVDTYRELIALRNANPELFTKETQTDVKLSSWSDALRTVSLKNGSKELYLFVNSRITGDLSMNVSFSGNGYEIISRTPGSSPVYDSAASKVTVPANSFVIIGSSNISSEVEGIETVVETLKVGSAPGAIVVYGNVGIVDVYSADGRKVAENVGEGSRSISVAPGLYVVKAGRESAKVAVR